MIAWILAAALQGGPCQAPSPAPVSAPRPEPSPVVDEVLISGEQPDARTEIDKRVYRLRDDPQVQTSTTLDILGKVPSVSVAPNGRVQLLGNSQVTILIDGKRPVNADAALKTLPAAQIDRIEVMTNPSAQYSAQGTAGIINIVTRRRTAPGLSGTLSANANSLGGGQLAFAPSLTRGPWTIEGSLSLARERGEGSGVTRRQLTDPGAGAVLEMKQIDRSESTEDRLRLSGRASYRPTDRDTLSLSVEAVARRNDRPGVIRATGFESYVERNEKPDRSSSGSVSVDYEHRGQRDGETLTASASVDYLDWKLANRVAVEFDDPASLDERYETLSRIETWNGDLKMDYVRPVGASSLLTTGVSWDRSEETTDQSLTILQGAGPGPASRDIVASERNVTALYATAQFPWGPWTVKSGLRLEYNDFEVRAPGIVGRTQDVGLFPSLYFRRKLTDGLQMNLSYSRRTSRPDAQRLNPYITFSSATSAQTGNPDLKPESTDAFEVRLEYARERFGLDLTLYYRETTDVWAQSTSVTPDAVSLMMYVNAGRRSERGGEVSLRGSVGARWKYSTSVNLFANRQQTPLDGVRNDFTWSAKGQIEYRTSTPDGRQPDEVQLSLRYFGPQLFYQTEISSFWRADFSWRHPLNDRVMAVLSVNDLFDSAGTTMRLRSPGLSEESINQGAGTTARVALVYSFK
jgi:outer membrane receptor protein involved in Fe transport